jgi:hypothetical protein
MELQKFKKNLIIVGNGGNSLKSKNGNFIDNCDVVIRVKSFIIEGFEDYVGTKTDIWSTKWFSYLESPFKNKINFDKTKLWIPILDPNRLSENESINKINEYIFKNNFRSREFEVKQHNDLINQIGYDNVHLLKDDEFKEIIKILQITSDTIHTKSGINVFHPTTYLLSIFLSLKRFPNHNIHITGFDSFKNGYYWNLNENKKYSKSWPHYYDREELYIKKLIYSNTINLID